MNVGFDYYILTCGPFGTDHRGERHREFNAAQPSVSFLKTPAWGQVKSEWRQRSLGSMATMDPSARGLCSIDNFPRSRSTAYLPEGPVIDWTAPDMGNG